MQVDFAELDAAARAAVAGTMRDEISPLEQPGDGELSLRPKRLSEFIGQEGLKGNLRVFLQAAQGRDEPLDHLLLYGPPGLGKTTLAHIVANEMNAGIHVTSGPAIERPGDLVGISPQPEQSHRDATRAKGSQKACGMPPPGPRRSLHG